MPVTLKEARRERVDLFQVVWTNEHGVTYVVHADELLLRAADAYTIKAIFERSNPGKTATLRTSGHQLVVPKDR